ncbi:MAG: response regulator [Candidatus Omnitrophica bacterium]|nr:response regulator [Candidatus Omnitrophota bacterium]
MNHPVILIVDDEKETCQMLAEYIQTRLAGEVVIKSNGDAAIDFLNRSPVDVLFQDLHMPGLGGFAVIAKAQDRNKDLGIFVITNWEDPQFAKQIEACGGVYIPKPLSLKVVFMLLEKHLKTRGMLKRLPAG